MQHVESVCIILLLYMNAVMMESIGPHRFRLLHCIASKLLGNSWIPFPINNAKVTGYRIQNCPLYKVIVCLKIVFKNSFKK